MSVVTATFSDDFNRANGPLGSQWVRKYNFGAFSYAIDANQCAFFTNTAGFHEDCRIPTQIVPFSDVTVSVNITDFARTGTNPYIVGMGLQTRARPSDGYELQFDGYSYELYRTENAGLGNQWILNILRLHRYPNPGPHLVLDVHNVPIGDVALPGVLTATANGPNLTATFTHAGAGPTLSCSVTDDRFSHGEVMLGCAHQTAGADTARHAFDNFSVVGTRVPATADLAQVKLDLEYSITHPNENNVGALLQRYRDEQNIERWEDYAAHVAAASSSIAFADDEKAFWDAFTPTP